MANPDFRSEAGGDQNGTASATISFTGLTWQANDIICVFVATDGYVPTLSTANGFAIAVDSNGNAASVTTNAGAGGTAECGMFVFWKRAVGANTTSDPEPVIAAPTGGGTTWCLETNAYLGARTTGTPWHIITTAIVSSATTTVAPPAVTPTLNAVLVMPCAASSTDDQAFNAWTLSGAASPAGQIDAGWHSGSSNQCAFTTGRGGYATTGGARSGSTTFSASTKQAQITLVMASLNEVFAGDEDAAARSGRLPLAALLSAAAPPADELPAQSSGPVDEDGVPPPWVLPVPVIRYAATSDDEAPSTVAASIIDEDGTPQPARPPIPPPPPLGTPSPDDETSIPAAVVDDDVPVPLLVRPLLPPPAPAPPPDDEFPGGSLPAGVDEEARVWSGPPAAPSLPVAAPAVADELIAAVTSGIGGASDAQRSFLAPPQTGTLSTTAPLPAWTTSHAYAIDPTQGAINRVQNGGNHYQCTQDGTSSSSGGGPSGTGTAISDGSTVWRFIGPVQVTNTAAGSQILCTVMRGNESQAATVAPTDNDGGGTYTLITDNQYASFAGSFAGVWRRPTASNAKTNFQTSGVWGGSGGAGDEMSIGWIELQGVSVGAPHASSHVERANSSGGTVTAAAITTTVPCIIISYWFGNGTVQTAGQPDAATPAGGLTLIAGSTGELSLTTAGYVQHMVASRKQSTPGTFSEVWTASPTDQGAQLVTIAYQDLSAPAGISVDDDTPSQRVRVVATPAPLRSVAMPEDELSPAADAGADDDVTRLGVLWVAPVLSAGGGADDEVAGQAVVDDDGAPVMAVPVAVRVWAGAPDAEELPTIALEEWGQVMAVPVVAAPVDGAVTSDDEIAGGAPVDEDNAQVIAIPVVVPPPLLTLLSDDELASGGGVSMIEEDATITTVPTVVRPQLVTPPSIDEVATASGASAIEDEQPVQIGVRPVERAVSVRAGEDELISGAVVVDEDQSAVPPVVVATPVPLARSVDEDALAPPSLEDDAPAVQAVAWAPLPAVLWVAADDDLPLAALVDEAGAMIALTWTSPLVGQAAPSDDDLPPGDVAAVIVDEDQLLAPLVWQVPALLSGPVVADELPRPKKPKPAATGTSLLDGFIAQQVASALGAAKMLKPATLIKVTPGVRTPGLISGGTNPTTKSYKAKGIEQNLLSLQLAGTLIAGVDAAIRLFGATIEGGQVPVAGDRIVMAGKTYEIVKEGVSRDPASVSYLCQCKL